MTDSNQWDWGGGFCKLHRGQDLPCPVCISTVEPHLVRDEVVEAYLQPTGLDLLPTPTVTELDVIRARVEGLKTKTLKPDSTIGILGGVASGLFPINVGDAIHAQKEAYSALMRKEVRASAIPPSIYNPCKEILIDSDDMEKMPEPYKRTYNPLKSFIDSKLYEHNIPVTDCHRESVERAMLQALETSIAKLKE